MEDGTRLILINNTRQKILNTLAQVEVNIDYPEYDDVEEATTEIIREKTTEFELLLTNLLKTARRGKILREESLLGFHLGDQTSVNLAF